MHAKWYNQNCSITVYVQLFKEGVWITHSEKKYKVKLFINLYLFSKFLKPSKVTLLSHTQKKTVFNLLSVKGGRCKFPQGIYLK